jgi:hypothetical protein
MKPTHTPSRTIRVAEGLWSDAKAIAAVRGETLTDVLTDALRRYTKRHAAELSDAPAKEHP